MQSIKLIKDVLNICESYLTEEERKYVSNEWNSENLINIKYVI